MGANHGGARTNAGRKTKFSEDKKNHVGLRCEQLHCDALKKQIGNQIYRFIHYDTEVGNEYYDIKRINKSKRNTFNSSPLGEEHRTEMDKLRTSMPNLALRTNAPYGSQIKIKQQVAEEFNITEQDVENIWKYFRKNYPDLM